MFTAVNKMWNLSDISKLCKLLILNVLLCEAGKTSLKSEPEPEPEEADLLVQYGVSGVIPEPESEPGYHGYHQGQYGQLNKGGHRAYASNPYYYWTNNNNYNNGVNNNNGVNYNHNYYQTGNLKL